jgi:hypothetical protein
MGNLRKLRDGLVQKIAKWLAELEGRPRGTLSMGMLNRTAADAEALLRQCIHVHVGGDARLIEETLARVTSGKHRTIDRLTFGECSKALQYLDSRGLLAGGRRLIPRKDRSLLDRTAKLRNDMTHRAAANGEELELVQEYLRHVHELCSLPVVEAAVIRDGN